MVCRVLLFKSIAYRESRPKLSRFKKHNINLTLGVGIGKPRGGGGGDLHLCLRFLYREEKYGETDQDLRKFVMKAGETILCILKKKRDF